MKIEQMTAPSQSQVFGAKSEAQVSARERAIQALMKPNTPAQAAAPTPQETPVQNPSSVSPEEMYAIKPPSSDQSHTNEEAPASAPEPKAETKVSDEPLSSQYAILARKEKALRQREQQLKAREAEMQAKAQPKEEPKPSFDPSKFVDKDKLTQDPFGVLNELGLSYDQLTELALNAPKPEQMALMNQVKKLEAKIAELEGKTETTAKSFQEAQDTQYKQAINQIRSEAKILVKNDPAFETIKATNSIDDVVELIERTFTEDGYLMSVEDAAQAVEEQLVEEALRLSRLNKIQQKLAPKPQAPVQKPAEQPKQQPLKTLTNSVASGKTLSAKERAILAFKGELQK